MDWFLYDNGLCHERVNFKIKRLRNLMCCCFDAENYRVSKFWFQYQGFMFDRGKSINKSSHSQMSFKKGVLKNFAIFTGKHLCWSLFLKMTFYLKNTFKYLFIEKRLQRTHLVSCEYCEIFKNSFFIEHLR